MSAGGGRYSMSMVHPEISGACARADVVLWDAFMRSQGRGVNNFGEGKLVFPKYRGGSLRVSEQEARFALVEALCQSTLMYSVEAPTIKRYQFTGKSSLSAQTDLAIHDSTGVSICNVEFKAKGRSSSAKMHFAIYKDLQKLLREPKWGLWFHLFEAVNNSTINDFLSVMAKQIEKVRDEFEDDIESPGLTIHVCVLQQRFSIQQELILANSGALSSKEFGHHLQLELKVSRSELLSMNDRNGWDLHRPSDQPANNRIHTDALTHTGDA